MPRQMVWSQLHILGCQFQIPIAYSNSKSPHDGITEKNRDCHNMPQKQRLHFNILGTIPAHLNAGIT